MSALADSHVAAPRPLAAALNLVDAEHPWLGLDSFSEETRGFFHGREEEIAELARRVQRKLLAILFGQSGLGKTSILRAGIVPRLRREGYSPVYVRIDYSRESPPPSEQIKQAIFRATEAQGRWSRPGTAVEGESLWEFLHHRDDLLKDDVGRTLTPLLIFDQFEEIFTLGQDDDFGRRRAAEFIADLADLVENRPPRALEARIDSDDSLVDRFDFSRADYRILIALREDYLAHLEGLKGQMPSITQNRMRLARMTGEQALAAVVRPGGRLVSEEVAEAIVRFVAGGSELRNAEVEPSLLSLVCRELNNARVAQGRAEISADLLAGSRDTILNEFYERSLADQPAGVRSFIEDAMLTESGFRESLAEERVAKAFAAAGAPAGSLAALVNRRLLRIEERLDVRRVELTHDVLCPVVKASRDLRHEREARDEAQRQLQAQREREAATHRALVRARQVAAGCAALAMVAVAGAAFGWYNMQRARDAEAKATQTRLMAESARGEAEKLMAYLLDDFNLELEPVGRLQVVANLSKRALDYYAALPAELRTGETERNRALAQVRYGLTLRNMAKLDEAGQALAEARQTLQRLREGGDKSEITTIGLSAALQGEGRVYDSRNAAAEAYKLAGESTQVLAPLMATASPSIAVRREYARAMNYYGFLQLRLAHEEESVKTFEAGRAASRSIDGLKDDLAAAASFAETTAWYMESLSQLGRPDDERAAGEEGYRIASEILDRRPGHMPALRARALITSNLGELASDRLRPREAMGHFRAATADWQTFLKLDPGNTIAWNNLAANYGGMGNAAARIGDFDEARRSLGRYKEVEPHVAGSAALASNVAFQAGFHAMLEADLGLRAPGTPAIPPAVLERAVKPLPEGSFERFFMSSVGRSMQVNADLLAGDYAGARARLPENIRTIESWPVKNPSEKRRLDFGLLIAWHNLARACYTLGDLACAEHAMVKALEYRVKRPNATMGDRLDLSDKRVEHAMVLAKLGRREEAAKLVAPELKWMRELKAQGSQDLEQHVQLARALYAAALANPAQARGLLAEASAVMEGAAPLHKRRSVMQLRGWIAEEQRRAGAA